MNVKSALIINFTHSPLNFMSLTLNFFFFLTGYKMKEKGKETKLSQCMFSRCCRLQAQTLHTISSLCAGGPSFNHVVAVMIPASTWPSLYNVSKKEYR